MLINKSLKSKLTLWGLIIFLLIAFTSATVAWYKEKNKPIVSKTEYVTVEKVKEVAKIKTVTILGPERIVTIEKQVLVEKTNMPEWFKNNTDEQAIASGVIQPYEGKTDVISTINTKTGVGQIIAQQEPLSFLGFVNNKELYGRLGYSTNSDIQATIGGDWKFARIGGVKIGVYGEGRGYFNSDVDTSRKNNVEVVGGVQLTW